MYRYYAEIMLILSNNNNRFEYINATVMTSPLHAIILEINKEKEEIDEKINFLLNNKLVVKAQREQECQTGDNIILLEYINKKKRLEQILCKISKYIKEYRYQS